VVILQSPSVLKSLIFLSAPAARIYLLSGEKATVKTSLSFPTNLLEETPEVKSQSLISWSHDEESKYLPSVEMAKSVTKCECPVKAFFGNP